MNMEIKEHGNYNLLRIIFAANKNTLTGGVKAMHRKNDNRQVEKRQRITDATLVVGMDIGCEFNAMCLMNKEGTVLGRYPKIYNSRKGFDYFYSIIEAAKKKHGFTDILIGMEPTGHYRKYLYFMTMRAVHRSPFFKEYYEHKQKNMKKKEALCAVVIKLIKVIFALLRDKRTFTEKQSCLKQAA